MSQTHILPLPCCVHHKRLHKWEKYIKKQLLSLVSFCFFKLHLFWYDEQDCGSGQLQRHLFWYRPTSIHRLLCFRFPTLGNKHDTNTIRFRVLSLRPSKILTNSHSGESLTQTIPGHNSLVCTQRVTLTIRNKRHNRKAADSVGVCTTNNNSYKSKGLQQCCNGTNVNNSQSSFYPRHQSFSQKKMGCVCSAVWLS